MSVMSAMMAAFELMTQHTNRPERGTMIFNVRYFELYTTARTQILTKGQGGGSLERSQGDDHRSTGACSGLKAFGAATVSMSQPECL